MLQVTYAYLVLVAFFMVELILRKNSAAKSLTKTSSDGKSTLFVTLSLLVVLATTITLSYFEIGTFENRLLSKIALVVMVFGLFLRVWSMITLKKQYTRTLVITDTPALIMKGPYSFIRHPGYLGTLLVWCAFGFALQNKIVCMVACILIPLAYSYRISNEEKMLATQFGEQYSTYKKHSWRLIPFIW